jgi:hypothetical protein
MILFERSVDFVNFYFCDVFFSVILFKVAGEYPCCLMIW